MMNKPEQHSEKKHNRLIEEKSPYLLQHADNPVDWYPWGPEAFEKARRENKPIFLSIGYSTCHWCHVMEHESFEDPEIGKLLNEVFVCIKVDREERPDIDGIYMTVCQIITGNGGWPLTIIMTPDKKPFFAGTYFPPHSRFGHLGILELAERIREVWQKQSAEVFKSAERITAALQEAAPRLGETELNLATLKNACQQFERRFDGQYGGFGSAPKFPTPHNLVFLLHYWKRTGDRKALLMVETTLQAMRRGGMYDHIGFGFHRYSTDRCWLVPHFEKMLYDQALLALAYNAAYQATGITDYAQTAREIFTYVLRDMTDPAGGFYSAEDADSEGVEGKFYVWRHEEIRKVLPPDEAALIIRVFHVEELGNFAEEASGHRTGNNILHLTKNLNEIVADLKIPEPDLRARLESARRKLFAEREKRIHPYKDDKILTDWNGLMIAALARGARTFDDPDLAKAANRAATFVLQTLVDRSGRLLHRYRDGEASISGNLDDYACLIWGLLELYETDFNVAHLQKALKLTQGMIEHFWDPAGGFYFTPDDGENLILRQKEIQDGAIPSGNSVAMLNLLRLARLTAHADLEIRAAALSKIFSALVNQAPSSYTQFLIAIDFVLGPSYEVVIAGDLQTRDTQTLLAALNHRFIPNKVVLLLPSSPQEPDIIHIAPFIRGQTPLEGRAAAYVCRNYQCQLPTTDPEKMLELLNASDQNAP